MMSRKKEMTLIAAGMLTGALLVPTAYAAVWQLTATPSTQEFYVDGKQTHLEAYSINGGNYVKLRDIGEAVSFNVYCRPDRQRRPLHRHRPQGTIHRSGHGRKRVDLQRGRLHQPPPGRLQVHPSRG